MTDTILSIVPVYGAWLIFVCVLLSCLALPVPSSLLVMTAGGFAAVGDLVMWQVILAAWAGFVAGDQIAYLGARRAGSNGMERLKQRKRLGALVARAEALLNKHGVFAVFLSRTIFSPVGPYVGYLSGALRVNWVLFSSTAAFAAVFWAFGYSYLGYSFASQISSLSTIISRGLGLIAVGGAMIGILVWLINSWRHAQQEQT